MIGRALHGAERGRGGLVGAGLGFAQFEEAHANALAAIGGQQHGLTEIEQRVQIPSGGQKRGLYFGGGLRHGQAGGGTHRLRAVPGNGDGRTRSTQIGGQVGAFVGFGAVVKIRPGAEYGQPQARQGR